MPNDDVSIYCDESTHLPNDGEPFLVLGAVTAPTGKRLSISKRIAELKTSNGLPAEIDVKWNNVSPSKLRFFIEIVDYFFDENDLGFRCVVAPKSGLKHHEFRQTHDDWYFKMMFLLVRDLIPPDACSYIYLDKKDTRSSLKVQKLHQVIANNEYDFDYRRVRRVQVVESHHVNLMQVSDLLMGAVNYANRELAGSEAKLAVVNRIRERAGLSLTSSTLPSEKKFNIFKWRPQP